MKRLAAVILALCVSCAIAVAQEAPKDEAKPAADAGKALTWKEAMSKVGQEVVVEGTVVNVHTRKGKGPDTLNFDKNWKESLSVAIFNKEKFGDTKAKYTDKKIRVKGKVTEYRGAAQIKVKDPSQIEIIP